MNAPAHIAGSDHYSRYAVTLDALLPGISDAAEREIRCRLLAARDIATANLANLGGHAQQLNLMIAETAGVHALAPHAIETLKLALAQCRRLMGSSAGALELDI